MITKKLIFILIIFTLFTGTALCFEDSVQYHPSNDLTQGEDYEQWDIVVYHVGEGTISATISQNYGMEHSNSMYLGGDAWEYSDQPSTSMYAQATKTRRMK